MITRAVALAKVQQALSEHGLDALVAVAPWNVRYLAGTSFLTQRTIPERLGLVVAIPGSEPIFVFCTIEEGHVREESWIRVSRGYTEFADNPVQVLASLLRELGVDRSRIGIEKRYLVAKDYDDLRRELPGAQLVAADSIFDGMRAVKTPEEIELLTQTALWTDAAIYTAFEQAQVGDTERSIGDRMVAETRQRGANGMLHLVLATGPNLFKVHHAPDDTRIEPGGVIRTDFGMFWGGYVSDIARTVFVQRPRRDQLDFYKHLEDIHQTVIEAMRPGVRCSDLYHQCANEFAARGLELTMPHIGHSIGLGVHEYPTLHPYNDYELEPGNVIMLEPLVTGRDGHYHTEDMIVITEVGNRVASRSVDWSQPMILD